MTDKFPQKHHDDAEQQVLFLNESHPDNSPTV